MSNERKRTFQNINNHTSNNQQSMKRRKITNNQILPIFNTSTSKPSEPSPIPSSKQDINTNKPLHSDINNIISILESNEFSIVYICGPSGIGKTTIMNELNEYDNTKYHILNPKDIIFDKDESIVSHFKQHHFLLDYIALNSIRSRLSNFNHLSEGERYRVIVGRLIKDSLCSPHINPDTDYIILDEFTSVLDRDTARTLSYAFSKCIRTFQKKIFQKLSKIILISVHHDIIPYLQPNLVILMDENKKIEYMINPNVYTTFDTKAILDLNTLYPLKYWKNKKQDIQSIFDYKHDQLNDGRIWKKLNKTITLLHKVKCDEYTKKASLPYDYIHDGSNKNEIVKVTKYDIIDTKYQIGIIFGPSGSGKTSTAKRLFGEFINIKWRKHEEVWEELKCGSIDQEILLEAVCLNETFGKRKYNELSIGEQHRVDIAVILSHCWYDMKSAEYTEKENKNDEDKWYIIDEFTSFVDRECGKKMAIGINEFVQRNKLKNIMFLTCHYDVIGYIDNVFIVDLLHRRISLEVQSEKHIFCKVKKDEVGKEDIIWNEHLFDAPKLRIQVIMANWRDFHPMFSIYHYKDRHIEHGAICFGAFLKFEDYINRGGEEYKLVGFTSAITADAFHQTEYQYSEHRTVVLPRYQGLGIGSRICDVMSEYLLRNGKILHSKTAHPRYGLNRNKNVLWRALGSNMKKSKLQNHNNRKKKTDRNNENDGVAKIYYCYIYKSLQERTDREYEKLKERIIVVEKT